MAIRKGAAILIIAIIFAIVFSLQLWQWTIYTNKDASNNSNLQSKPTTYMSLSNYNNPACSLEGKKCMNSLTISSNVLTNPRPRACSECPKHSFCFFGSCPCHPGYSGDKCDTTLPIANPWYKAYCPNLKDRNGETYNPDTLLKDLGGEFYSFDQRSRGSCAPMKNQPACAYLCYAHPQYGAAVVPHSLWRTAQEAESALWKSLGGLNAPNNDRAEEHWRGFGDFACLPPSVVLGKTIEVGAGPWTQIKGMLYKRPDAIVNELTIFEPGADKYMTDVASCSYRSGKLEQWGAPGRAVSVGGGDGRYHSFPVVVRAEGGELLHGSASSTQSGYDTLISINVLEHVQDAFKYLTGLFQALKPGGYLIFHERYYDDAAITRGDEYHPVRVKRQVFDAFLSEFDIIFNNCQADYDGRAGESGYYVIARKRVGTM